MGKAREIEQRSKEQKEVGEIKGREEESKLGKEPKENEVDAEIDAVRAKEEAKAKAPQGFFNGIRPDSSKCTTTIGRQENVKDEEEYKAREEEKRRRKEKEEEERRTR